MLCIKINIDIQGNKYILYYLIKMLFKMPIEIVTHFKKIKFFSVHMY